jgi:purine-binding chemotaxis protein CheW
MENLSKQFATFYICDRLYGIDVMQVQEVTQTLSLTPIRMAPNFVRGLINLRGQIATAVGMRELFGLAKDSENESQASVVCKVNGGLISLLVDRIGDVIEVSESNFENTPDVIEEEIKKIMKGVYKTDGEILSVIDTQYLSTTLNLLD